MTLSVVVLADGRVAPESIRVVKVTHEGFVDSSIDFVKDLLFWPGCRDRVPVSVRIEQVVTYEVVRHR